MNSSIFSPKNRYRASIGDALSDPLIHKLPCLRNIYGITCLFGPIWFFFFRENDWLGKDLP